MNSVSLPILAAGLLNSIYPIPYLRLTGSVLMLPSESERIAAFMYLLSGQVLMH